MMSIKTRLKSVVHEILHFLRNPCIYVAAVIGTLVGFFIGAAVGIASGGFIGYSYNLCAECVLPLAFLEPGIGLGAIVGVCVGSILTGVFSGAVTMLRVHKKTRHLQIVSHENITGVLLTAFYISIEMAIGMGLGAIIGSLKFPGTGSVLGAMVGIALILFISTFRRNKK